ncbi:nucleotidyltransferase domain-containing protein [Candidatus Woesearchaeota archaeon]|nr:nucleotidyltransferase domain-containing protein [Candidatus Woesearchaeota archaeon]
MSKERIKWLAQAEEDLNSAEYNFLGKKFDMDQKTKLIKELKIFKNKLKKSYDLKKLILFGSFAKGKQKKHSDVDLVVVSQKFKKNLLERSPPLHLKWDLDYPVDFLCFTEEEFERKKKSLGIVKEAAKEGIII